VKLIPLTFLALTATGVALADEPVGFQQGMKLLTKYNCQTCHSVDNARTGPSLHAVAKKYASDPHARSVLSESIVNAAPALGTAPPHAAHQDSRLRLEAAGRLDPVAEPVLGAQESSVNSL